MDSSTKHQEELSIAVHASLLTLHALATLFHLRKKDKSLGHAIVHASAGAYSAISLVRHIHSLKEKKP